MYFAIFVILFPVYKVSQTKLQKDSSFKKSLDFVPGFRIDRRVGLWAEWSAFSECTAKCVGQTGIRVRQRFCPDEIECPGNF